MLNVFIAMNRMNVEGAKVMVACLHLGPELNPLRPVGAVGGFNVLVQSNFALSLSFLFS